MGPVFYFMVLPALLAVCVVFAAVICSVVADS